MDIKVIFFILASLAVVSVVNCECSSDSLRQFAIDACHITKRSANFKSIHFRNKGYDVEHVTPKYRSRHGRPSHSKKLTRDDFPSGAYLLVHPAVGGRAYHDNDIDEEPTYDSDSEYYANEILTEDMPESRIHNRHKHKHAYRFKRNAQTDILIEQCCSEASADKCGKYFCH